MKAKLMNEDGTFHPGTSSVFDTPANKCPLDQAAESTGAVMVFSCAGKLYNTEDLLRFETNDAQVPFAYLDPWSSLVFIEKRDRWKSEIIEVDVKQLHELSKGMDLRALIDELKKNTESQIRQSAAASPNK